MLFPVWRLILSWTIYLSFLSSVRLSAFLISSPFLGSRNIPLNVKIVFSMVISFFILVIFLTEISINEIENLFIIVVIEAIIGIALGLSLSIWFSAATLAGEKMASSTGLGFSMMVDPKLVVKLQL